MTRNELTKTLGAMAAISRMNDGRTGRPLPIRYRVAEKIVGRCPEAKRLTWEQAVDLGLHR